MQPNELNNAMKVAAASQEMMGILSARVGTVLELYRQSMGSFLMEPRTYDPTFNMNVMAIRPRHAQEKYFKRVSECLMVAAVEATLAGERFHTAEHIRAAVKLEPEKKSGIPGVAMPDLDLPGKRSIGEPCACGHPYGAHLDADKGPCMDLYCNCKHFTKKPG